MKLVYASLYTVTILLGMVLLRLPALAQPSTDKPIGILLAAGDISTCGNEKWHRYANKTADILRKEMKDSKDAQPPVPVHVLAFWHTPTFSSGRHGHDYKTARETPLTKTRPMQTALHILYDHGASVVLTGHDHNYEQFSPHDPEGKPAQDGIRSFVVGTGGSLLTEDTYDTWHPILKVCTDGPGAAKGC